MVSWMSGKAAWISMFCSDCDLIIVCVGTGSGYAESAVMLLIFWGVTAKFLLCNTDPELF